MTDSDFSAAAELDSKLSTLDIQKLSTRRDALGSRMRQWMKSAANPQGYDLLITPAVAIPAFDAKPAGHTPMTCEAMLGWTPFSYPFNLTQQAACAIPCGLTKDGLPIGLEIVGSMFGDALVLRAARRMNNCSYFLGLAYSKRNKSRASVSRNVMNARKMW